MGRESRKKNHRKVKKIRQRNWKLVDLKEGIHHKQNIIKYSEPIKEIQELISEKTTKNIKNPEQT